jgi:hypothetical protein
MVASAGSPNSAFAAAVVDTISGQTDMRKMRQNRAIDPSRRFGGEYLEIGPTGRNN